ncbi:MAG: YggS family pyridoxal phosphate-dependent enzyme [Nitrosomonadales bacterium]|nr:YggS family pyridoxal phosphate-dependent enzyme [Nitrosomonadales bacterium]
MTTITSNWQAVSAAVDAAAQAAGRTPGTVGLLAVSKTFPAAAVREAYLAGQRAFGESYVQEALDKMAQLADLPLEWHFIGPLQSNKTRLVAEHFAWVHGVDRLKIAERLSAQRPASAPPLNVCIQVNVSGEATKSGVSPEQVEELARAVAALPRLRLRGLMAIPAPADDMAAQHMPFAHLRALQEKINAHGLTLDTLSMGMSHDFVAAIAEGATLVRVGTAIFGQRDYGGAI